MKCLTKHPHYMLPELVAPAWRYASKVNDAIRCIKNLWQDQEPQPRAEFLDSIAASIISDTRKSYPDLADIEEQMLSKIGPQGYGFTYNDSYIEPYYDIDPDFEYRGFHPVTEELMRLTLTEYRPIESAFELAQKWIPERKSNSGADGWQDRRTSGLVEECAVKAMQAPNELSFAYLTFKNEKQKKRATFCDSFSNQLRGMRYYHQWFSDQQRNPVFADRGYLDTEKQFTDFVKAHRSFAIFEGDVKAMDTAVLLNHARYESLWYSNETNVPLPVCVLSEQYLEQVFTMPLVTPDGVVERSLHALFSGLYITHNFENPLTLDLNVRLVYSLPWKDGIIPEYGTHYIIVVCGDDSAVILDRSKLDPSFDLEQMKTIFTNIAWNVFRFTAHPEKQRVSTESMFFCKRYFSLRRLVGDCVASTASLILTLNALFYPRGGARFTLKSDLHIVRAHQVLMNATYHPLAKSVLIKLLRAYPEIAAIPSDDLTSRYLENPKDWSWKAHLMSDADRQKVSNDFYALLRDAASAVILPGGKKLELRTIG